MSTRQTLICGNNLELLARMPDCSAHAVVTDPPYGLSSPDQVKSAIDRVSKVFRHRSLPDLYEWDAQAEQEAALPGVGDRGAPLCGSRRSVGVDRRVGVPEGSVDLDRNASDHEVDARTKAPRPGVTQGNLPIEGDAPTGQFLGNYIFQPGHGAEGARDVLRGGLPELFLGGFSVTVTAALPAGLPGAHAASSTRGGIDGTHDVGSGADPFGQPGGSPGVVAGSGTVLRAALRFDTAGAPRELGPAPSADDDRYGDTARPNLVRARSGASRLATMAKPFRVRLIDGLAHGAGAFFHLWLPFKLPVAKLPRGGFMGKDWDAALPDPRTWVECLRVLRPGGHLVAFGAPRLVHRLTCQIEDAGFEVRDQLLWVFAQGFPKSLDVSKAIDAAAGAAREVVGRYQPPNGEPWNLANDVSEPGYSRGYSVRSAALNITAPATPESAKWAGWGTALKPAYEPIVLARKPLDGTVAQTVQRWGTGALNIDGCRVDAPDAPDAPEVSQNAAARYTGVLKGGVASAPEPRTTSASSAGRWPANLILDEAAGAMLDVQSGTSTSSDHVRCSIGASGFANGSKKERASPGFGDAGGASRFFKQAGFGEVDRFKYCPKASRAEREAGLEHIQPRAVDPTRAEDTPGRESPRTGAGRSGEPRRNHHPTVKPVELMRWLVRLVTPPDGIVLEPFAGSGSTLVACALEDVNSIGMEIDPEYIEIARARVVHARKGGGAHE